MRMLPTASMRVAPAMTAVMTVAVMLGSAAWAGAAQPPRVVTDIAPIHSLVAMVMGERGAPMLLLPGGQSPHGYALKPSQARELQEADVVVRVGGSLAPWLSSALRSTSANVVDLVLLEAPGTRLLAFREGVTFDEAAHDHSHEHETDEDVDPHAWLDPHNAMVWLAAIAEALTASDPDGAAHYARNAAAAQARVEQLSREIATAVAPFSDTPFLVYHDAFHYFESRFGIEAVGSVARGDAAGPGARRLRDVRNIARSGSAVCLFTEPQLSPRAASTVATGTPLRRATLDPLGQGVPQGPALYLQMMRRLVQSLVTCLSAH